MDFAAELIDQNRAFGDLVAAGDPAGPVPSCPGWTLQQLFRHVGRGDRWAAQMVVDRATEALDPRAVPHGKPPEDPDGAISWLHDSARTLVGAVAKTGPDVPVWTFLGPRPASWWIRRRLHEVVVHRADAALAVGAGFEVEPALAADTITEWLELMAAQPGEEPAVADGHSVHLHATDDGLGEAGEWTVVGHPDGITWSHSHGKGTVALRGPAADLLLALTRRQMVADTGVEVFGDPTVWETWRDRTPF